MYPSIDLNGNEVVKYVYDPWGRILSTTGSLASTLGTHQPFRYRGYVYDVETGLYYLRSRYYNSVWGRFISADIVICHNLFCYCKNNSVCLSDAKGKNPTKAFASYLGVGGKATSIEKDISFFDMDIPPRNNTVILRVSTIPYIKMNKGTYYVMTPLCETAIVEFGSVRTAKAYRNNQSSGLLQKYVGLYDGVNLSLYCDHGCGIGKLEDWDILEESHYADYLLGPYDLRRHDNRYSIYVENLQQALVNAGYDCPVTGYFDGGTEEYVKMLQEECSITIDGIVGPETKEYLLYHEMATTW